DEPAAHLDSHAETALRDALGPWLDARTVLVAAHRPELVARLDRVVQLGGDVATHVGLGPEGAGEDAAEANAQSGR
ncbi:MAG: hypothetical protein ACRDV8_08445, partial [Acidimicrobiales bacterium]